MLTVAFIQASHSPMKVGVLFMNSEGFANSSFRNSTTAPRWSQGGYEGTHAIPHFLLHRCDSS